MERLWNYFMNEPKRIIELGWTLFAIGNAMLLGGFIGLRVMAPFKLPMMSTTQVKSLADLYPSLPTFWIPENFGGWLLAVVLFWLGLSVKKFGKMVERL